MSDGLESLTHDRKKKIAAMTPAPTAWRLARSMMTGDTISEYE